MPSRELEGRPSNGDGLMWINAALVNPLYSLREGQMGEVNIAIEGAIS